LAAFSNAAFTANTSDPNWNSGTVAQHSNGNWCFFSEPRPDNTIFCMGNPEEVTSVLTAHLQTATTSVNYYKPGSPAVRLGGPELPVDTNDGNVYLCLTGQASDGKYVSKCSLVTSDNEIGFTPGCERLEPQANDVTDGCYANSSA
ncbi:hypothetical protein FA15DRAFT_566732, partial [Coprinopsis marcescibilis]